LAIVGWKSNSPNLIKELTDNSNDVIVFYGKGALCVKLH